MLIRFAEIYSSLKEIPPGTEPLSLGSRDSVRHAIDEVLDVEWWEDDYGLAGGCDTPEGSVEISLGDDADRVEVVWLHVRATEAILPRLFSLAAGLECQLLDPSTGRFITADVDDPGRGLREWREFRDRALDPTIKRVVVGNAVLPVDTPGWEDNFAKLGYFVYHPRQAAKLTRVGMIAIMLAVFSAVTGVILLVTKSPTRETVAVWAVVFAFAVIGVLCVVIADRQVRAAKRAKAEGRLVTYEDGDVTVG